MTAEKRTWSDERPGTPRDAAPGEPGGGSLDDATLLGRHAELVAIDNVIGLEATVARLENDLRIARSRSKRLRERVEECEQEIAAMRASRTWKMGRIFTRPMRRLKG